MRLFISYAHVDKLQVSQLVEVLEEAGYSPWFDPKLMPGQNWKDELRKAIQTCDTFLYALSPESVESEWCQWEFAEAVKIGKPIIPVLLHAKTKLPEAIGSYQYADFTEGPTAKAVARLLGGLRLIAVIVPPAMISNVPINPVGTPSQADENPSGQPTKYHEIELVQIQDILPQPFSWCNISAGKVTLVTKKGWAENYVPLDKGQTFDVSGFDIAKYPLTNAQFSKFIEANGYNNERWWSKGGWKEKVNRK